MCRKSLIRPLCHRNARGLPLAGPGAVMGAPTTSPRLLIPKPAPTESPERTPSPACSLSGPEERVKGVVAREVGYACHLTPVVNCESHGSGAQQSSVYRPAEVAEVVD
jgi:hypothetical protein